MMRQPLRQFCPAHSISIFQKALSSLKHVCHFSKPRVLGKGKAPSFPFQRLVDGEFKAVTETILVRMWNLVFVSVQGM